MKRKSNAYTAMAPYVILAVALVVTLFFVNNGSVEVHELKTGELIQEIKEGNVTEITITPKSSESVYYIEGKLDGYDKKESFVAKVISEEVETITAYAKDQEIKEYETEKDPGSSNIGYILINIVPIIVLVIAAYFMFTKLAAGNTVSS